MHTRTRIHTSGCDALKSMVTAAVLALLLPFPLLPITCTEITGESTSDESNLGNGDSKYCCSTNVIHVVISRDEVQVDGGRGGGMYEPGRGGGDGAGVHM